MHRLRQAIQRRRLQGHDTSGHVDGAKHLVAPVEVAVQIGSGQRDHQRRSGPRFVEAVDRVEALSCVQGDQDVGFVFLPALNQLCRVPQLFQQPLPAHRGRAVPAQRRHGNRADQGDVHGSIAQVRNPAKTSRRFGVK